MFEKLNNIGHIGLTLHQKTLQKKNVSENVFSVLTEAKWMLGLQAKYV